MFIYDTPRGREDLDFSTNELISPTKGEVFKECFTLYVKVKAGVQLFNVGPFLSYPVGNCLFLNLA